MIEEYEQKIDSLSNVIQEMHNVPPKLIKPIMNWKQKDILNRKREANRIAREFKEGYLDPAKNVHLR